MKTLQGEVTALNNAKTAHVKVSRSWQHPLYKKLIKRSSTVACHAEGIELAIGDQVEIVECKPLSATKHFKVVQKIAIV
jgi:small subunit ribosomal protein S17